MISDAERNLNLNVHALVCVSIHTSANTLLKASNWRRWNTASAGKNPIFPLCSCKRWSSPGVSQSGMCLSETVTWGDAGASANCTMVLLVNVWYLVLWDSYKRGLKHLLIFMVETLHQWLMSAWGLAEPALGFIGQGPKGTVACLLSTCFSCWAECWLFLGYPLLSLLCLCGVTPSWCMT